MSKKRKKNQMALFDQDFLPPIKALNISLYDLSSAPLNPYFVDELVAKAEEIANRESSLSLVVIKD